VSIGVRRVRFGHVLEGRSSTSDLVTEDLLTGYRRTRIDAA
jgi:hypothetical protein